MTLSSISLGNLKRRAGKSILLTAGLAIGVAMVVAMTGITVQLRADVEKKLDEYGANIIVSPRSESMALSYGGVGVTAASYDVQTLEERDIEAIKGIHYKDRISAIAPKLIGSLAEGGRRLLIVGVDFPSEFKIKKWWRMEGAPHAHGTVYTPPSIKPGEVVLGHSAAEGAGLAKGDTLTVAGATYPVAGVLEENASQDDYAVFMDRREAGRALGKPGAVSLIEVSALCSECPIDDIVAEIGSALPTAKVSAVRQAMTLKMQTVDQLTRFSIAVSGVVLLIGALIVFVSMLSSVNERTKEIGVLRAIGFRKSHILRVVLIEAFTISLMAGFAGWLVGSLSITALASRFVETAVVSFDPVMLGAALSVSIAVGMASSLYPAIKASNLEPLEALRYI